MRIHRRAVIVALMPVVVSVIAFILYVIMCSDGFTLLAWINLLCKPEVISTPSRPAFFPTEETEWCITLRKHYQRIRREFRNANPATPIFSEVMPEQWNLSDPGARGKWRVVVLRIYGRDTNVAGFPLTRKLLRNVPGCTTAMFSILEPGRELVTHQGPNHGVLRYHLALVVPCDATQCTLIVNDEVRHWHEGEDLLFDDTLPHSAKNESRDVRVVLFLDVLRPLQDVWRSHMNNFFHWLIAPNTLHIRSAVRRANECVHTAPTYTGDVVN
jgi:ornithine lipid ester-linked acyl 2-hydroxylase